MLGLEKSFDRSHCLLISLIRVVAKASSVASAELASQTSDFKFHLPYLLVELGQTKLSELCSFI